MKSEANKSMAKDTTRNKIDTINSTEEFYDTLHKNQKIIKPEHVVLKTKNRNIFPRSSNQKSTRPKTV